MNIEPEMRIGDAEREAAASALGEHFAAGRLTREEYDERSTSVWSATTYADLRPLFEDLPSPQARQRDRARSAAATSGTPQRDSGGWSHRRWGRVPFLPVMLLIVVLVIALPGPPWPLFILFWLWIFGFFRFRRHHWGR